MSLRSTGLDGHTQPQLDASEEGKRNHSVGERTGRCVERGGRALSLGSISSQGEVKGRFGLVLLWESSEPGTVAQRRCRSLEEFLTLPWLHPPSPISADVGTFLHSSARVSPVSCNGLCRTNSQ